jgi:general stress protein YciG
MDPSKQREIASKGGKAAHEKGTAHEFTSEEARIAGRKGGAASRMRRAKSGNGPAMNPAGADGDGAMTQTAPGSETAAAAGG